MKRELKFKRVYFEDEAQLKYIKSKNWGVNIDDSVFSSPTNVSSANSFIDCQYSEYYITGKQLSEGDLIQGDKYFYKVVFKYGAFYLEHTKKYLGDWGLLSRMFDADFTDIRKELIHKGDIYENSDLLS